MDGVTLALGYYIERPYGPIAGTAQGENIRKELTEFTKSLIKFLDQNEVPRTLFIIGEHLEKCLINYSRDELRKIYDSENPLNEIQQHTYSHLPVRDIMEGKKAVPVGEFSQDVARANSAIREILGTTPNGLGVPYGHFHDLSDMPGLLAHLDALGITYVSSDARSKNSLEAPLTLERQPHSYRSAGYPEIIEIPLHGWQDAIFTKEKRRLFGTKPWSTNEIIAHYAGLFEQAMELQKRSPESINVALGLHPWAVAEYDPELQIHEKIIGSARDMEIEIIPFGEVARRTRNGQI